jgi:hypothetical protein
MRFSFFILALLFTSATFAQLADPLVFSEKTHDFGSIRENGGSVSTEFSFINKTGRTIRILNVQPSCGCTTPDWTREPIDDGKSGVIKASFDPRGKAGYFNKTISVTSDYNNTPIVLAIKGNVEETNASADEADFEVLNGSLKTKVSTFNIGKIFINKENGLKSFDILNAGKSALTFGDVKAPAYIKVQLPAQLKPGEKSTLKIYYDTKLKNTYGFTSDNIEISTNDAATPLKSFSVFATIEEYFPPLTDKTLEEAPALKIENGDIKFGDMQESATLQREVLIKNTGKKDLSIRALQPNCSCVTATMEKNVIKVGETVKVKISFAPKGRPGIQNKSIAVYSNDPQNPVQRITLSGNVR